MSRFQQLLLALGVGFFAGGIIGAYAMTVIYGDRPTERIAPSERCPICDEPEPCPPPPACEPSVPMDEITDETDGSDGTDTPAIEIPDRPGLPATAIRLAGAAMKEQIKPCLDAAPEASGTVLFDLTVTATGGQARLREVKVVKQDGPLEGVVECMSKAAHRVEFEWEGPEGESKFRHPVRVH